MKVCAACGAKWIEGKGFEPHRREPIGCPCEHYGWNAVIEVGKRCRALFVLPLSAFPYVTKRLRCTLPTGHAGKHEAAFTTWDSLGWPCHNAVTWGRDGKVEIRQEVAK